MFSFASCLLEHRGDREILPRFIGWVTPDDGRVAINVNQECNDTVVLSRELPSARYSRLRLDVKVEKNRIACPLRRDAEENSRIASENA